MTDKYTTVRLDRTVHNDVSDWAARWGITRTEALTMLVRRGLAAAVADSNASDERRAQREAESARTKPAPLRFATDTTSILPPVLRPLPVPARVAHNPEPVPAPIVPGLGNSHLADLTTAVELLREAINAAAKARPAPTQSETRMAAVGGGQRNGSDG